MKKVIQLVVFVLFLGSYNVILAQNTESTSQKKALIIYGSDDCHHCIDTKAFLKKNNIEFVFYDIDKNPEALKEMLVKLRNKNINTSSIGIPVVDKDGELFSNNGNFEEFLLKLK